MKTILLFLALVSVALCVDITGNITAIAAGDIKGYSADFTLPNNTASTLYFNLGYDNATFGTDLLNFYASADSDNTTETAKIQLAVSSQIYAINTTTGITFTNLTNFPSDGSSAVSCGNYTSTTTANGTVWTYLSYPGGIQIPVTVEFTFAENCSVDNFGSDLWIWILVIVIIIIIVIVIVAAGVAGFLYWKKKQSGNYALYNDS